jgi:hypothetical protein
VQNRGYYNAHQHERTVSVISLRSYNFKAHSRQARHREREREMEGMVVIEGEGSGASRYTLKPTRISNEDILLCIDVDAESLVEMKSMGPNGRPFTRLDSIKQAILLFVNAKLSINPEHRFAFATLSKSASWVGTHTSLSLRNLKNLFCWIYLELAYN